MSQGERLHTKVSALAAKPNLDSSVRTTPAWANSLMDQASEIAQRGFQENHRPALKEAHQTLRVLYDQHLFPNSSRAANQYNPYLLETRHILEDAWMSKEAERSTLQPVPSTVTPDAFPTYFEEYVVTHPASAHPLYDHLAYKATKRDMLTFFHSEQPLDVRFFDIVVLSALGTDGVPRAEVAQNIYDEAGHGQVEKAHTTLYRTLLNELGFNKTDAQFAGEMDVEALAGYNLFQYLGQHRDKYNEFVGAMGVTELFDPPLYTKFMRGAKRLGLDSATDLSYYTEHISVDVAHGDGWMNRVMLPALEKTPDQADSFMRGAELRIHTATDYYDAMYAKLGGTK